MCFVFCFEGVLFFWGGLLVVGPFLEMKRFDCSFSQGASEPLDIGNRQYNQCLGYRI